MKKYKIFFLIVFSIISFSTADAQNLQNPKFSEVKAFNTLVKLKQFLGAITLFKFVHKDIATSKFIKNASMLKIKSFMTKKNDAYQWGRFLYLRLLLQYYRLKNPITETHIKEATLYEMIKFESYWSPLNHKDWIKFNNLLTRYLMTKNTHLTLNHRIFKLINALEKMLANAIQKTPQEKMTLGDSEILNLLFYTKNLYETYIKIPSHKKVLYDHARLGLAIHIRNILYSKFKKQYKRILKTKFKNAFYNKLIAWHLKTIEYSKQLPRIGYFHIAKLQKLHRHDDALLKGADTLTSVGLNLCAVYMLMPHKQSTLRAHLNFPVTAKNAKIISFIKSNPVYYKQLTLLYSNLLHNYILSPSEKGFKRLIYQYIRGSAPYLSGLNRRYWAKIQNFWKQASKPFLSFNKRKYIIYKLANYIDRLATMEIQEKFIFRKKITDLELLNLMFCSKILYERYQENLRDRRIIHNDKNNFMIIIHIHKLFTLKFKKQYKRILKTQHEDLFYRKVLSWYIANIENSDKFPH